LGAGGSSAADGIKRRLIRKVRLQTQGRKGGFRNDAIPSMVERRITI